VARYLGWTPQLPYDRYNAYTIPNIRPQRHGGIHIALQENDMAAAI